MHRGSQSARWTRGPAAGPGQARASWWGTASARPRGAWRCRRCPELPGCRASAARARQRQLAPAGGRPPLSYPRRRPAEWESRCSTGAAWTDGRAAISRAASSAAARADTRVGTSSTNFVLSARTFRLVSTARLQPPAAHAARRPPPAGHASSYHIARSPSPAAHVASHLLRTPSAVSCARC